MISRNGHEFRGFKPLCAGIVAHLKVRNAIIDGEICCLAEDGRRIFNPLLFRRGQPYFYAFDLLWLNGRDLRKLPVLRRKEKLQGILSCIAGSPILYTAHLDAKVIALFNAACENDLEGIVAKRKDAPYDSDERSTAWIKIKNPQYSRSRGRRESIRRCRARLRSVLASVFDIRNNAFF